MPSYDRPYFESPRERERRYRDRDADRSFGRRGYGRRDDDDDRGSWISRDRGDFESGRRRRFDEFEDWQRPRELAEFEPSGDFGRSHARASRSRSIGRDRDPSQGRFTGRGPKGYQRSDERLREDVCDRLTVDSEIDASNIEVSVRDGEVTLDGSVPDRFMKRASEDCIENISGVKQVHNRVRVEANDEDRAEVRDPGFS